MHLDVAVPGRNRSWNTKKESPGAATSGLTCSACKRDVTWMAWASWDCRWLFKDAALARGGQRLNDAAFPLAQRCSGPRHGLMPIPLSEPEPCKVTVEHVKGLVANLWRHREEGDFVFQVCGASLRAHSTLAALKMRYMSRKKDVEVASSQRHRQSLRPCSVVECPRSRAAT